MTLLPVGPGLASQQGIFLTGTFLLAGAKLPASACMQTHLAHPPGWYAMCRFRA
jgi:hypothetical protein